MPINPLLLMPLKICQQLDFHIGKIRENDAVDPPLNSSTMRLFNYKNERGSLVPGMHVGNPDVLIDENPTGTRSERVSQAGGKRRRRTRRTRKTRKTRRTGRNII